MKTALRKMRKEAHLSQTELGEAIGYSLRQISSWEREEVEMSFYDAYMIAEFFGCSLDDLAMREIPASRTPIVEYSIVDIDLNDSGNEKLREYAEFLKTKEENTRNGMAGVA